MWSRGSAAESEVSDVYVRLGYEFNIACRAFNAIGVDTSDLGPVPDLLRAILEDTLSQERIRRAWTSTFRVLGISSSICCMVLRRNSSG